jgi:hypothetical protein
MKVTAILSDDLVAAVQQQSGQVNITQSLKLALTEWLQLRRITSLNREVREKPLEFKDSFSANRARAINRRNGHR